MEWSRTSNLLKRSIEIGLALLRASIDEAWLDRAYFCRWSNWSRRIHLLWKRASLLLEIIFAYAMGDSPPWGSQKISLASELSKGSNWSATTWEAKTVYLCFCLKYSTLGNYIRIHTLAHKRPLLVDHDPTITEAASSIFGGLPVLGLSLDWKMSNVMSLLCPEESNCTWPLAPRNFVCRRLPLVLFNIQVSSKWEAKPDDLAI